MRAASFSAALVTAIAFCAPAMAFQQTYESCAITASSLHMAINDQRLGVALDKVIEQNPLDERNYRKVYALIDKKGLEHTYIATHLHYFKCAEEVRQRVPMTGPSVPRGQKAWAVCAYDHGVRFAILDHLIKKKPRTAAKATIPPTYHRMIDGLFDIAETGSLTKALAASTDAHDRCVEKAMKLEH